MRGDRGPSGARGLKGDSGDKGPVGSRSPTGKRGVKGPESLVKWDLLGARDEKAKRETLVVLVSMDL